jgi:hypothetical protein
MSGCPPSGTVHVSTTRLVLTDTTLIFPAMRSET